MKCQSELGSTGPYWLENGAVYSCSSEAFSENCSRLKVAIRECVQDGKQLYTLSRASEEARAQASHYNGQDWEEFNFDQLISVDMMSGLERFHYRNPTSLSLDHQNIIIQLDEGTAVRAPVTSEKHLFVEHSQSTVGEDIDDALHVVATRDGAPNMMFMIKTDPEWGPGYIDNRWEKLQAIDVLKNYRSTLQDPNEIAQIDTAIEQLRAVVEDNSIIFSPYDFSLWESNSYCDDGECVSPVEQLKYYEAVSAYTMRFTNVMADEVRLNEKQWAYVTEPLQQVSPSAAEEREAIREASRRWLLVLGSQTGQTLDIGGWIGNTIGTFIGFVPFLGAKAGQTNCIYSYYNSYELLRRLQAGDLLRFHQVADSVRGALAMSEWGMHNAAQFIETETQQAFVLDPWPMGPGYLPDVVGKSDWLASSNFSWDMLPSAEAISQTSASNRLIAAGLGLYASYLYGRRQVGRRLNFLTEVMPAEQRAAYAQHPFVQRYANRVIDPNAAYDAAIYPPHIHKDLVKYLPPEFVAKKGVLPTERAMAAIRVVDAHARSAEFLKRDAYALLPATETIEQPLRFSVANYLRTPKGALQVGVTALLGALGASSAWAGSPDGIPEPGDAEGVSPKEILAPSMATGYVVGESIVARYFGNVPLFYEMPLAFAPLAFGGELGAQVSNQVGESFGAETLRHGQAGNGAVTGIGSLAAYALARRVVGEAAWEGSKRALMNYAVSGSIAAEEALGATVAGVGLTTVLAAAGAFVGGYGIGTALDQRFGASDWIATLGDGAEAVPESAPVRYHAAGWSFVPDEEA